MVAPCAPRQGGGVSGARGGAADDDGLDRSAPQVARLRLGVSLWAALDLDRPLLIPLPLPQVDFFEIDQLKGHHVLIVAGVLQSGPGAGPLEGRTSFHRLSIV